MPGIFLCALTSDDVLGSYHKRSVDFFPKTEMLDLMSWIRFNLDS